MVLVEAFLPQFAFDVLDEAVFDGPAMTDRVAPDLEFVGPLIEHEADKLGAIVAHIAAGRQRTSSSRSSASTIRAAGSERSTSPAGLRASRDDCRACQRLSNAWTRTALDRP